MSLQGKQLPSDAYKSSTASSQDTPLLIPSQRKCLDKAIRVDQAGEIAANYIYKGQLAVLGRDPTLRPLLQVIRS